MKLVANADTNQLNTQLGFATPLQTLQAILGTSLPLAIQFASGGIPFQLPDGAEIKFGAKVQGDYDGKFVVSNYDTGTESFLSTLAGTGANAIYNLLVACNTTKLANLLGNDPAGFANVTDIYTVGDIAGSLDGKYFKLYDKAGSVGVWIALNNGATAQPAGATACTRQIKITTINTADSAASVATKLAAALDADAQYTAAAWGDLCSVTDAIIGPRTAAVDGTAPAATGFEIITDIAGSLPHTMTQKPSISLMAALQYSVAGVPTPFLSCTFTVFNSVINNQEGVAMNGDPAYPAPGVLMTVATLTGLAGGAGKLDGIATAGLPVNYAIAAIVNGVGGLWQLQAGAAGGDDVAPADYNAGTNNKKWVKVL